MNIEKILGEAIKLNASDVHLICNNKPMVRIAKDLIPIKNSETITPEDMSEIYDFLVKGNIQEDEEFTKTKKLDISYEYKDVRLIVNISLADEIPTCTLRIIKKDLPEFKTLGMPEIVKKVTQESQGLILVTGRNNSGKSTTLNVLINYINENQNRKIVTLENPIEYKHSSKKSLIVQKEVGKGKDVLNFNEGIENALKEDCDVLVLSEIKDRKTLESAIEMAESGCLVIGTLNTKSCVETIEKIVNLYDKKEQSNIKYSLSALLKLVISQRLLQSRDGNLILAPEVMVVDNIISGLIRKDEINISEIEKVMQENPEKGNITLIDSLANLFIGDKICLDLAKSQIAQRNMDLLNKTIMQLKIKKEAK